MESHCDPLGDVRGSRAVSITTIHFRRKHRQHDNSDPTIRADEHTPIGEAIPAGKHVSESKRERLRERNVVVPDRSYPAKVHTSAERV